MRSYAWGNVNGSMNPPRDWRQPGVLAKRDSVYDKIPTSHAKALVALRDQRSRSIGYETSLKLSGSGSVYLVHDSTSIVEYLADGSVIIDTADHLTATTKARINAALAGSPWSIVADRGWHWYQFDGKRPKHVCEFHDGDRVYLEPGRLVYDGIFLRPGEVSDRA